MSEEREEVYQILELGKHEKNLHHKKGFGGLLFIDLSMIKFSKLSSYIRQLDKENKELKKQLHDASIQIQELTEQDMWCPSNCEKLEKLQCKNQKLKEEVKAVNKGLRKVQQRSIKYKNRCLKLNEKIKKIKQPQMFIDTQDIEERYAEELYRDFLKEENKQLKDKLSKIETLIINHNCDTGDIYYKYNSKFLKSELKQRILEIVYEEESRE